MTRTNIAKARKMLRVDMSDNECRAFARYCWIRSLDGTGINCQELLSSILDNYSQDTFEDRRIAYREIEFTVVEQGKHGTKYIEDMSLVDYLLKNESDCVFFERLYGR